MKVRVTSQLPIVKVGSSTVRGKELTSLSDNVGYAAYEIVTATGETLCLPSPFGDDFNHIYYCISGTGEAVYDGSTFAFVKETAVALTGKMVLNVTASDRMRLFGAYIKADPDAATVPDAPVIKRLADIIGGERDMDWQRGRSRRFFLQSDNFNITLTSTLCYPNETSKLEYKNNYEVAYYIRGDVTYIWKNKEANNRVESHHFCQASPAEGEGCVFIMDENDAHTMQSGSQECETICLFYPSLKGSETHTFSKDGTSSY